MIILLILLLSVLSYNLVEKPFRSKNTNKQFKIKFKYIAILFVLSLIYFSSIIYYKGLPNRFAKINGIRISLIDVEDLVRNLGYSCAILSNDYYLKIFVEIQEEIDFDLINIKKEISKQINISLNSIKLIKLINLPRLDSGKINYKRIEEIHYE